MFQPKVIRACSVLAMIVSVLGLVASGVLMPQAGVISTLGMFSWALLLWASFLAFRLSSYPLHPHDLKKLAIRVYLILAAFAVFLTLGVVLGLVFSVAMLAALWGMKRNYDEWTEQTGQ